MLLEFPHQNNPALERAHLPDDLFGFGPGFNHVDRAFGNPVGPNFDIDGNPVNFRGRDHPGGPMRNG